MRKSLYNMVNLLDFSVLLQDFKTTLFTNYKVSTILLLMFEDLHGVENKKQLLLVNFRVNHVEISFGRIVGPEKSLIHCMGLLP